MLGRCSIEHKPGWGLGFSACNRECRILGLVHARKCELFGCHCHTVGARSVPNLRHAMATCALLGQSKLTNVEMCSVVCGSAEPCLVQPLRPGLRSHRPAGGADEGGVCQSDRRRPITGPVWCQDHWRRFWRRVFLDPSFGSGTGLVACFSQRTSRQSSPRTVIDPVPPASTSY